MKTKRKNAGKQLSAFAPIAYLEAVRAVLDHLRQTQLPAIEKAAALVARALSRGGAVFCSDIGHGIQNDFINRAGGLAAVQAFTHSFTVSEKISDALKDRPRREPFERDLETIRLAVRASCLRPGDVMLVGSVSGRNRAPVELALACRALGVKTIGFTSLAYTAKVEPLHPSKRKLSEVVDVVIDIGAPYGDAAVEVKGFKHKVLPVSGVATDVAGWMLWARVMEIMASEGKPPTVFMSINRKGGKEAYEKSLAAYHKKGY